MYKLFTKIFQKIFFKQWVIGIKSGSKNDIIYNSNFLNNIKWLKPSSLNRFYADPFIIFENAKEIKIIFEELKFKRGYGTINIITVNDKYEIINRKKLLDTKSHLSYPFIFIENNKTYIFPESAQNGKLSCYEFDPCLEELNYLGDILNLPLLDSTILKYNNQYWLFGTLGTNTSSYQLNIYFSDNLLGPYSPHKLNPVRNGLNGIRSAGSFIEIQGEIYRPTQNCEKIYGDSITINKIIKLSEDEFYEEKLISISMNKNDEEIHSIHTINVLNDIIVVDGQRWTFSPFRQLQKFKRDILKKYTGKKYSKSRKGESSE